MTTIVNLPRAGRDREAACHVLAHTTLGHTCTVTGDAVTLPPYASTGERLIFEAMASMVVPTSQAVPRRAERSRHE